MITTIESHDTQHPRLSSDSLEPSSTLRAAALSQSNDTRRYSNITAHNKVRARGSWSQQRFWAIDKLQGDGKVYHIGMRFHMTGHLDTGALNWALNALVQRHEILRTTFVNIDDQVYQDIHPRREFTPHEIDLGFAAARERRHLLYKYQREELEKSFDLTRGPLIRGLLIKAGLHEHLMLITMHRIITDAWSFRILQRELSTLYNAYLEGMPSPPQPLPIQYADYAEWQIESFGTDLFRDQLNFWRERLTGAPAQLDLPTDRPRPRTGHHTGQSVEFFLPKELELRVRSAAQHCGMSPFTLLFASWAILLSKLCGQEDIVIGTTVSNRRHPPLEQLIGPFENILPIRVQVFSESTFREFLAQISKVLLDAHENPDAPFDKLVELMQLEMCPGRHPIFQTMLTFENEPQSPLRLRGIDIDSERLSFEMPDLDVSLSFVEHGKRLIGVATFSTALFCCETIHRWLEYFKSVLTEVTSNEEKRIAQMSILSESERRQVIYLFNATQAEYPKEKLLHELFEEQVDRTPHAVAVVYEQRLLTYSELNTKSNQLAWHLQSLGVRIGEYLPVLMNRSPEMLIAQIAILKVGGVYVPVDPHLPPQRQAFMINDCGARWIVVDNVVPRDLAISGPQLIDFGVSVGSCTDARATRNPKLKTSPVPAAYVMYTSGSTGDPKGVVVPHHAVVRLVINNGYARISSKDCLVHHSNPGFDASTFEIWGALLNGGRLVVAPQSVVLEVERFVDILRTHGVSLLWMSVGLFNRYADVLTDIASQFRYLIVGGDVLDPRVIRRVLDKNPPQFLLNAYGPTECTTFSTTYLIEAIEDETKSIPIGRPISNSQVYILDGEMTPVPIGVVGEIYIAGAGVARGYLNRPDLTAKRFLSDPFSAEPQARMYKTGDLGRWRSDGVIEYLGRNDYQVKIRGFRIEPGEIEAQLTRYGDVKQAVVLAREDEAGEKRLVAYVVPRRAPGGQTPSVELLRDRLKETMPEYMVPSAFVMLDGFPLTPNGKLDRRALPPPELRAYASRAYEAPQGQVEEVLASIWQELLHVERVGRQDNFFELGGHSLIGMKVIVAVRKQLHAALSTADIFRFPSIQHMANAIAQSLPSNGSTSSGENVELEEGMIDLSKDNRGSARLLPDGL